MDVQELILARTDILREETLPPALVLTRKAFEEYRHVMSRVPVLTVLPLSALPATMSTKAAEEYVDMVVEDRLVDNLVEAIHARPYAATIVSQHIRATEDLSLEHALLAESIAYSLLQSGSEYRQWITPKSLGVSDQQSPAVTTRIADDGVVVELAHPHRANALGTQLRQELTEILIMLNQTQQPFILQGQGRHFCAGGDLSEFNLVEDPTQTHRLRTVQALPLETALAGSHMTVRAHGSSVGAGVELLAFAHRVVAHPEATFRLPEVHMGLMPGCGGTVSLPRRIGRSASLVLMITGMTITASQAHRMGLVDELIEVAASSTGPSHERGADNAT